MSSSPKQSASELLDLSLGMFQSQEIFGAMEKLQFGLSDIRHSVGSLVWKDVCAFCRLHPISKFVYQDPFTKWSYEKPHGFPGDATLLDFIYQADSIQNHVEATSDLGRAIYKYTCAAPAPTAVRYRLSFLTRMIDELADRLTAPCILSLACGHLREAQCSGALRARRIGRFVAVDQDVQALEVVANELSDFGVDPVQASVIDVVKGRREFGQFDLVYASGICDYLSPGLARKLAASLFSMLRPGGNLLVPNFMPGILDAGYMESFMDWHLVYRTPEEMIMLASGIPEGQLERKWTFIEKGENIVFLQIAKAD